MPSPVSRGGRGRRGREILAYAYEVFPFPWLDRRGIGGRRAYTAATDGDSWFRACVCVWGTQRGGRGSRRKEKSQIQWSSGGTERERVRRSLSFSLQPYISLSHSPCGSHRMGGRRVLGTRRVSIKWLWPVRYGNSFPYGYAYAVLSLRIRFGYRLHVREAAQGRAFQQCALRDWCLTGRIYRWFVSLWKKGTT